MAFTDPQSITVNSVATSLPRVITGTTVGNFVSADAAKVLTLDPRSTSNRKRNVARLNTQRVVTDPLVSTLNTRVSSMVSLTADRPLTGVTDAQIVEEFKELFAWATANSYANLLKFAAGEN